MSQQNEEIAEEISKDFHAYIGKSKDFKKGSPSGGVLVVTIMEALDSKDEQIARLSAEVERLKHDKEIAFNVGVEQSNEIVTLTAHISLLVEGVKEISKDENNQRCLHGHHAKQLLQSPPISHHIEIREAEKKVVEKAVAYNHSRDYKDAKQKKYELIEAVANYEHLQSKQNSQGKIYEKK